MIHSTQPPATSLLGNTDGIALVYGSLPAYFSAGNNVTLSGLSDTGAYTLRFDAAAGGTGGGGGIAAAAGTQTATSGTVKFADSNGVTFGMSLSTQVTATVKTAYVGLNTAGTNMTWTVNSSGVSINAGGYAGTVTAVTGPVSITANTSGVSANVQALGTATAASNVTWTANTAGVSIDAGGYAGTATGATNASLTVNSNGVSVNAAIVTLSRFEPHDIITASGWSSHAQGSTNFVPLLLRQHLAFQWVECAKSMSPSIPAGTSSATIQQIQQGYTYGISLFSRQDNAANSTNLTYMTHGSLVVTVSFTHNQTSQGMTMSWLTDSTGGGTSTNTTSNSSRIASYFSGPRHIRVPFPATTLTPGEYWLAFGHTTTMASTMGTANTIMNWSNLHLNVAPSPAMGIFGSSTETNRAFVGGDYPIFRGNASAITTNNTMAASVISVTGGVYHYVNLGNY